MGPMLDIEIEHRRVPLYYGAMAMNNGQMTTVLRSVGALTK